jgi:hypothetical protein
VGVSSNNIRYLCDKEATTERIQTDFQDFLQNSKPEDHLFFYYCGHGYTSDEEYYFASYDCTDNIKLPISFIVNSVFDEFTGKSAILLADCCVSGYMCQLVEEKNKKNPHIQVASLASVYFKKGSTANWTFSNAVLGAMYGQAYYETDSDGSVSLPELEKIVKQDMALVEKQYAATTIPISMTNFILTNPVQPKKHPRIGECVNVDYDGTDYLARIEDFSDDQFLVRYFSYLNDEVSWITPQEAKKVSFESYKQGTRLEIQSDSEWYACSVLQNYMNMHLISYDEYDACYNEWAVPDQLRLPELGE